MRPQQKSFVVEIKSKGRRSAVRQGSIWGTTDLKALARQAAGIAPQLFDDQQKPDASVNDDQSFVENAVRATDFIAIAPDNIEAFAPINEEALQAETILAAVKPELPKETVKTATPSRRWRKSTKATVLGKTTVSVAVATVTTAGSSDELEMLERENRILKDEFTIRLQRENLWLRSMLERF